MSLKKFAIIAIVGVMLCGTHYIAFKQGRKSYMHQIVNELSMGHLVQLGINGMTIKGSFEIYSSVDDPESMSNLKKMSDAVCEKCHE